MNSERIHWVDVAKGILIILVVYGHLDYFAATRCGTEAFNFKAETNFLFLPYYMPAFFVLTGVCSNFKLPFELFLKKNFLSLIIPNIIIGVCIAQWIKLFLNDGLSASNFMDFEYSRIIFTTGSWFLPALFLSKCILYGLLRIKGMKIVPLAVCLSLMFIGMSLYNRNIINLWYYQHAFIAIPFLIFGVYLKQQTNLLNCSWIPVLGGAVLIISYYIDYPYLNANPHIQWRTSLLYIMMSGFGSIGLFWLSKKISSCSFLELIGRHTLVIYLLHGVIMPRLISMTVDMGIEQCGLLMRIIIGIMIVYASIFICLLIDLFIDRHFSFLKGFCKSRSNGNIN